MSENLPDTNVGNIEYIRKQEAVDYCKALMNAELVQNTDDWGYGKERYNQTEVILEFIENRQPADVVQVVHGKWIDAVIKHDEGELPIIVCNKCNTFYPIQFGVSHNFCPNCGAKMDEEE